MVSSRILLLAAILLAVASVRGSGETLLPPSATAPAPAPSACGDDNCSSSDIVSLGVCVDLQLGRVSPANKDRCCRRIRGMPNAAYCLSKAFSQVNLGVRAKIADEVEAVLAVCDMAHVFDLACLRGR